MSNTSVTGSVKFFNAAKGFGFIAPEDGGKDVFVPAASISASGLSRLKAGQRVSFELEPDAKGPKAVKLAVLEEAPAAAPLAVAAQPQPNLAKLPPAKKPVHVYSDSATANGAVEDVMEALTEAGETPRLIELGAVSRDELKQLSLLLRESDQSLVKRYDPLFLALQLDDRFISEADFWTGIAEHPSLVNGPVVAANGKARICKSAAEVKAFLGAGAPVSHGTNGKPKGISSRMAALMRGEALPPRPVAPPPEPEPPARVQAKAARSAPEPEKPAPKKAEVKKVAVPAKAPAKAKPAAMPEPKSVKKAAAKVVKKAKAAPAKTKKKK